MGQPELVNTIEAMMQAGKGLLAMDESNPTCHKRFAALRIPQTVEARRAWRELILTTPKLGEFDQRGHFVRRNHTASENGWHPFPPALDRRGDRSRHQGGRRRKRPGRSSGRKSQRGPGRPARTPCGIPANGGQIRQVAGGNHDRRGNSQPCMSRSQRPRPGTLCRSVPGSGSGAHRRTRGAHGRRSHLATVRQATEATLHEVFSQLYRQRVLLEGMILKPNMVLPGKDCPTQAGVEEVADATVSCLLRAVPAAVPGVAFLSGGQAPELASARLNAMHVRWKEKLPWVLTFSYSRAIQQPALDLWKGSAGNVAAAQQALCHWAECNSRACQGRYHPEMEKT